MRSVAARSVVEATPATGHKRYRTRRNAGQWARVIAAQRESELTVGAFCRRRGADWERSGVMIPSSSVRAYVCVEPVDMRKQIDGLAQMVQSVFAADAFGGPVFVFLGKRRNKVKLLWWDRHGFFLLYKRLERGVFPRPQELARSGLSMVELMAFLEGIDLSRARRLAEVAASRVA